MAKVTIERIDKGEKLWQIHYKESKVVGKMWASSPLGRLIEEGKEYEISHEKKDGKFGVEHWLASVNGETGKTFKGGTRGPVEHKEDPKRLKSIELQVVLKEVCLDRRAREARGEKMDDDEFAKRFNFYASFLDAGD